MQSHLAATMFLAPGSRLSDGVMQLCLVREGMCPGSSVPRRTVIDFLLSVDTG